MSVRALSIVACVACLGLAEALLDTAAAQQQTQRQVEGSAPGAPLPALVPANATVATPPEISVSETPAGSLFADGKGFTLYVTDRDTVPGTSTCAGPCAEQWVPLRSEADTKPFGDWTLVQREDGKPQWAYKGRPLYRYHWEAKPHWAEAQNEVWHYANVVNFAPVGSGRRGYTPPPSDAKVALPPGPGTVTGNPTPKGLAFADSKSLTLYSRVNGAACAGECLDLWMPLRAAQAATPIGDWTIVARNDGTKQWAFQGKALYRYAKDQKPGDINGASDEWTLALVPVPGAKPAAAPTAPPKRAAATLSRGAVDKTAAAKSDAGSKPAGK